MDSDKVSAEVLRVRQNATTQPKGRTMTVPTWMGAIFTWLLTKVSFSVEVKLSFN